MRTEKEIEEMAVSHANSVSGPEFPEWHGRYSSFKRGFGVGYSKSQEDLLESASEGFEEWHKINCEKNELSLGYTKKIQFKSWQAAKLSDQKIIQEKDQKIAELERTSCRCDESVGFIRNTCHEQKYFHEYNQAVNDLKVFIRETLNGAGDIYLQTLGNRIKLRHGISEG